VRVRLCVRGCACGWDHRYHVASGLALAIGNDTLHSKLYGKDNVSVPSKAYGWTSLEMVPRYDQDRCTSRNCQNYDDTQMW
jgi:hypothetical protein